MNVATIFPLWPGNIGLVQAAVALPLVPVRRRLLDRLRVRDRAPGGRDVRRRGRRPDLPRRRGALVRHAAGDAGCARRARSRRTTEPSQRRQCARWRVRLALRASSRRPPPPPPCAEGLRAGGTEVDELPIADGGEGTEEVLRLALGGDWRGGCARRVRTAALCRLARCFRTEPPSSRPPLPSRSTRSARPARGSSRGFGGLSSPRSQRGPQRSCSASVARRRWTRGRPPRGRRRAAGADARRVRHEGDPAGRRRALRPQKGAGPAEIASSSARFARSTGLFVSTRAWWWRGRWSRGGLASLGAELVPGAHLVLDAAGFDASGYDLVVTGEGRVDADDCAWKGAR